jgi:DNA-binding CsgD family transcriptional regulator
MNAREPTYRSDGTGISPPAQWPLTGRQREVDKFAAICEADRFRGVVIHGAAGVGKTRLAREFMCALSTLEFTTICFSATAANSEFPLGIFLPLLTESSLRLTAAPGSLEQLHQCLAALTALCSEGRLGILIDNAELLDQASAFVLQNLIESSRSVLVATVRDTSLPKVTTPLTELWKDEDVEFIDLPRLTNNNISELLLQVLAHPVHPHTIAKLSHLCDGNLFYLRELVNESIRDGKIRLDLDTWHLIDTPRLSTRLKGLIERQLAPLTQQERTALEYVSAGEPVSLAALESVCLSQDIKSLESRGLIASTIEHGHLEYRVHQPVYAEFVRQTAPITRLREISKELTSALSSDDRGLPFKAPVKSDGWLTSGDDPELLFIAAKTARAHRDFDRAQKLACAAANAGRTFELNCFLAIIASLRRDRTTAAVELTNSLNAAENDDQLFELANAILDNCLYQSHDLRQTISFCSTVKETISDPELRGSLSDRLSFAQAASEGVASLVQQAANLLATASDAILAWAAIPAAYAFAHCGQFGHAYGAVRKGELARRSARVGLDQPDALSEYALGEISAASGRVEQAYATGAARYDKSVADESPEEQAWFLLQMCKRVGERGYPRTTVANARTGLILCDTLGPQYLKIYTVGYLSLALALSGRLDEAKQTLSSLDTSTLPRWDSELIHVEAWIVALAGNTSAALELLSEGARRCVESGDVVNEAAIIHSIARLGDPRSQCQRMSDLAVEGGDLIGARAEHVQALVAMDPEALDRSATTFERCGAWLLATEALANSVDAYKQQGRTSRALAAAHRALTLKHRCESPDTPTLRLLDGMPQLTKSESQVARLASQANTNKQIATHLNLSIRTVENHLRSVYRKLAVNGREQLPAILGEGNPRADPRGSVFTSYFDVK